MVDLPYIIQWRRGTKEEWASVNPVLAEAEAGVETDTLKVKLGDGTHPWTELPYLIEGSGSGGVEEAPADGSQYGRQNKGWTRVTGGGGGIPDAPADNKLYGRKNNAWGEVVIPPSYNDSAVRALIATNTEDISGLETSKADKTAIPDVSGLQPKAQEVYINTAVMTLATVDNTDYYGVVPTTSLVITSVGAGTSSISLMTGADFSATLPDGISFDGGVPEWKNSTSYTIVIHNNTLFVSQGVTV